MSNKSPQSLYHGLPLNRSFNLVHSFESNIPFFHLPLLPTPRPQTGACAGVGLERRRRLDPGISEVETPSTEITPGDATGAWCLFMSRQTGPVGM